MSRAKREKRKERRKKRKAEGKGLFRKLGKAAKGAVAFTVLKPFQGIMKKALKKKGHTPPKKLADIAAMFFEVVVQKKEHLEIDVNELISNYETYELHNADDAEESGGAALAKGAAKGAAAGAAAGPWGAAIGAIVSGIIAFFKNLKKKKDAGEAMTPAEEELVKDAEQVSATVSEAAADEAKFQIGDLVTKYWYILAGAAVLLIVMKKK